MKLSVPLLVLLLAVIIAVTLLAALGVIDGHDVATWLESLATGAVGGTAATAAINRTKT